MQDERVVEYASGTFSKSQRKYGPCERETLGVILAIEKWKNYLLGGKADLLCDCRALKWLTESQSSSSKLWRWAMRLTEFDVNVIHVPGRNMQDVDALSRAPLEDVFQDPTDVASLDDWKDREIGSDLGEAAAERCESTRRGAWRRKQSRLTQIGRKVDEN